MFQRYFIKLTRWVSRPLRLLLSPRATLAAGEVWFRLRGDRKTASAFPTTIRSLLIVRPDGIGDVVLSSGLIREIRRQFPAADITLVVADHAHNLAALCPHANQVLSASINSSKGFTRLPLVMLQRARTLLFAASNLWPRKIEVALLPRFDTDWYHGAYLAYFSGAAIRVGYRSRPPPGPTGFLETNMDSLFTSVLDPPANLHEAARTGEFLAFLGFKAESDNLELWLSEADELAAVELLGPATSRPLVAFGIGAGSSTRTWPMENFAQVGAALVRVGCGVVLLGGSRDAAQAEAISRQMEGRALNLAGRCSLRETGAVLKRCVLFVGNDSGPMHIAAAAGTRVVEISCHPQTGAVMHPASPKRFSPWKVSHRVLQPAQPLPPCHDACTQHVTHCITQISVIEVLEAIARLVPEVGGLPRAG